jgi:hypothetical protein
VLSDSYASNNNDLGFLILIDKPNLRAGDTFAAFSLIQRLGYIACRWNERMHIRKQTIRHPVSFYWLAMQLMRRQNQFRVPCVSTFDIVLEITPYIETKHHHGIS